MPDGWITVKDAATFAKVTPQAVRRWCGLGRDWLKHEKYGRTILIDAVDLRRFKGRKVGRPAKRAKKGKA